MPRPLIAIAVVTVLLVAGCAIEEEAAEPTTTTTTTVSEAAVSEALQEMFADWTEQDCAEEAVWYYDFYTPYESDKHAAMLDDIEAERYLDAQMGYWDLWTLTTGALDDYALWMEICAAKSSPELVAEIEAFPLVVEEARNALEEECYAIQVQLVAEDQFVDSSGKLLVWSDCIPP